MNLTKPKLKHQQELLEEPNRAFAELRHLRHKLQKQRMFNYEDADSDTVLTLLTLLDHLKKVASEAEQIVEEQTGRRYSDNYKE